jgi:hypothetical protein
VCERERERENTRFQILLLHILQFPVNKSTDNKITHTHMREREIETERETERDRDLSGDFVCWGMKDSFTEEIERR